MKQLSYSFAAVSICLFAQSCSSSGEAPTTPEEPIVSSSSESIVTPTITSSQSQNQYVFSEQKKFVWSMLNPNVSYGEITDSRDNQPYKTIKIGTQTWMAEDLAYTGNNCIASGTCKINDASNMREFLQETFPDDESSWSSLPQILKSNKPVTYLWNTELCPSGFRLPSLNDFKLLAQNVNSIYGSDGWPLRASKSWPEGDCGSNATGMTILPNKLEIDVYSGSNIPNRFYASANYWTSDYEESKATVISTGDDFDFVMIDEDGSPYTFHTQKVRIDATMHTIRCISQ